MALVKVGVDLSAVGASQVVAGSGQLVVRVYRLVLNFAGPQTINFVSRGAGDTPILGGPHTYTTGGGIVLDITSDPWLETLAGEGLFFVLTTAARVVGQVGYNVAA